MVYEHRKHSGELPIVGVNTFLNPDAASLSAENADSFDMNVTRSDKAEKLMVIERNIEFKKAHAAEAEADLAKLRHCSRPAENSDATCNPRRA